MPSGIFLISSNSAQVAALSFLQMNELAEVLALAGTVCTTSSSGTKPYFCLDFSICFSIAQQLKDEVSDRTYIVCWPFLLGFFPW